MFEVESFKFGNSKNAPSVVPIIANDKYRLQAVIDGYLVQRTYDGYTEREALELWYREFGGGDE